MSSVAGKGHLRLQALGDKYACGVKGGNISSSRNPWGVTCRNCLKTYAYEKALREAR